MGNNYHVVYKDEQWKVKREGAKRAASVHDLKTEANEAGRKLAKRNEVELVIHDKENRIQNPNSFGKDPCPPKDKKH